MWDSSEINNNAISDLACKLLWLDFVNESKFTCNSNNTVTDETDTGEIVDASPWYCNCSSLLVCVVAIPCSGSIHHFLSST